MVDTTNSFICTCSQQGSITADLKEEIWTTHPWPTRIRQAVESNYVLVRCLPSGTGNFKTTGEGKSELHMYNIFAFAIFLPPAGRNVQAD
jgi:hypothetical protein